MCKALFCFGGAARRLSLWSFPSWRELPAGHPHPPSLTAQTTRQQQVSGWGAVGVEWGVGSTQVTPSTCSGRQLWLGPLGRGQSRPEHPPTFNHALTEHSIHLVPTHKECRESNLIKLPSYLQGRRSLIFQHTSALHFVCRPREFPAHH